MKIVYFILVIFLISYIFVNTYKTKKYLHMMQQNLYNENNRYIKWIVKNSYQFINLELIVMALALIGIFVIYDLEFISNVSLIILSLLLFLSGVRIKNAQEKEKEKKSLVFTPRIKRLTITTTIVLLVPIIILLANINNYRFMWIAAFVLSLTTYLNSFVVFISLLINMPIEKLIYIYYKTKAVNKLKRMDDLKIIGITGSYGKTSSKNILSNILNVKYNALPTPKNLNTYNGIIMTINNYMDKFTNVFIAEMGAYVKGEIAGLCKLIKPKYGILTTIGTAHLESFGSEENIVSGKFELIESLPSDGFAILNGDDEKQVNYNLKNKVKTIWIGINNENVDIRAKNIICSNKGTNFDVIFKDDETTYHFETKLLGLHNIYNILSSIACAIEFAIPIEDLIKAVKNVKAVEHRLELKKIGNFYMIDDAYNSNPIGAKNALDVLSMMPGEKIVVTPGMIELGKKEEEYNKKFGEQLGSVADYVILVGEKKTKPIKEGLLKKGFDKDKIIVFNDVRDAYPFIGQLATEKEVYALFENDLPDTYNE